MTRPVALPRHCERRRGNLDDGFRSHSLDRWVASLSRNDGGAPQSEIILSQFLKVPVIAKDSAFLNDGAFLFHQTGLQANSSMDQ